MVPNLKEPPCQTLLTLIVVLKAEPLNRKPLSQKGTLQPSFYQDPLTRSPEALKEPPPPRASSA